MLTVEDSNKFDWKSIPLVDCLRGNALDAYFTLKVYQTITERLDSKMLHLYDKLMVDLIPIFTRMEFEGLLIDPVKLEELKVKMKANLDAIEFEMKSHSRVPKDCNLGSPQDLVEILFSLRKNKETKEWDVCDDVGFGLFPIEFTKNNQPKTDEDTLIRLKELVDSEFNERGLSLE